MGRHTVDCSISFEPISNEQQEWYRDLGCDWDDENQGYLRTGSYRLGHRDPYTSWEKSPIYRPQEDRDDLFSLRHPNRRLVGSKQEVEQDSAASIESCADYFKCSGHQWGYFIDVFASNRSERIFLCKRLTKAFRPELISIKPTRGAETRFLDMQKRGISFLRSEQGRMLNGLFLERTIPAREGSSEQYQIPEPWCDLNNGCQRLCDLLNALGSFLIGESYEKLFHLGGNESTSAGELAVHKSTTDIVVLKKGRQGLGSYGAFELAAVATGNSWPSKDAGLGHTVLPFAKDVVSVKGLHVSAPP